MESSEESRPKLRDWLAVLVCLAMILVIVLSAAYFSWAERAALATCQDRQQNVAKAILEYASAKDRFPGYQTLMLIDAGNSGRQTELKSWHVAALEVLDKAQYDAIRRKTEPQPKHLPMFQCPVGTTAEDESINYVANCGRKDGQASSSIPYDWKANGVFMRENLRPGQGVREELFRTFDLVDPPGSTIMISENLQATRWTELGEADIGIVWFAEPDPEYPNPPTKQINVGKDVRLTKGDYNYARPSSNHPGGVIVAFCDGSSAFLSENISYGAYCRLMTPDGKNAKDPGTNVLSREYYRFPLGGIETKTNDETGMVEYVRKPPALKRRRQTPTETDIDGEY